MAVRLYLMRHATAAPHGAPAQDPQRPLTESGHAEAQSVAKGLMRLKILPSQVVASPYLRAKETAQEAAKVLGLSAPLKELSSLRPESNPELTCADLKSFQGEALLFVGHEPHMSRWVAWLVDTDGNMNCLMKKAGVACVEVEQLPPSKGSGILRWLMTPKQLSIIGKG